MESLIFGDFTEMRIWIFQCEEEPALIQNSMKEANQEIGLKRDKSI